MTKNDKKKKMAGIQQQRSQSQRAQIWFGIAFDFLRFASVKSLNFHNLWSFKNFHNLPIIKKPFFFSTGIRKGTNMFNGPANLRKSHRRKRD